MEAIGAIGLSGKGNLVKTRTGRYPCGVRFRDDYFRYCRGSRGPPFSLQKEGVQPFSLGLGYMQNETHSCLEHSRGRLFYIGLLHRLLFYD